MSICLIVGLSVCIFMFELLIEGLIGGRTGIRLVFYDHRNLCDIIAYLSENGLGMIKLD